METISKYTIKDLELIIKGTQEAFNYNEPINDAYELEWKITDKVDFIHVRYEWVKGIIPGEKGNPEYAKDSEPVVEIDSFKIFKSESIRKFTKEVIQAIEQVVSEKFDEDMAA